MDLADPRNPRYVTILAFATCLILLLGWLARPHDVPQSPPPVASETELQELARRAQRRSLESTTAYFAGLAANFAPSLAFIGAAGLTGIVWDATHIVTGPLSDDLAVGALTVNTASGDVDATRTASSPRLPLSALEAGRQMAGARIVRRAESLPATGDWVIAVWQADGMPAFAAANFRQAVSSTCGNGSARELTSTLSLTREMVGGALIDMDGHLLGVILPCRDHIAAVNPASVDDMLASAATLQERLLARYGVLLGAPSEEERRYFEGADGVFVREVRLDRPAEAAGFRPGDLVVALNGQPVTALDDLRALTERSETPLELRVRRGTAMLILPVGSGSLPPAPNTSATDLGLRLDVPPRTYLIASVRPQSPAARASIRAGDRLVRIDGVEPRNRQQAERGLGARPTTARLLEIERDTRRLAVLIPGVDSSR